MSERTITGEGTDQQTDQSADVDIQELFRLLGHETRMSIMRTLWEAFEFAVYVTGDREGLGFATLRERAGIRDSGNFNYHLGELTDILVESRGGGYVLTPLGYNLMRSIGRYENFEYRVVDEWTVEESCPFCDGRLVAAYNREILEVHCRDCGGLGGDGNFTFVEFPSTGSASLSRRELLDAATLEMADKVRSSMHGVCWDCHAPMELEIEHCADHDRSSTGICDRCSHRYSAKVEATCRTCGTTGRGPVLEYAVASHSVGGFFGERGCGPDQLGPWEYRVAALASATETGVSTDPPAVELRFTAGDTTVQTAVERRNGQMTLDWLGESV
jgi:hypothetical protein